MPRRTTSTEGTTRRGRSFAGCATCRSRHVKCDEVIPECSTCKQNGLSCGGYEKSIFFDLDTPEDGLGRFRRPLLTLEERQRMSLWLTSAVPPKAAFQMLSEIDEQCDDVTSIQRGPFGAFKLTPSQPSPPPDHLCENTETREVAVQQDLTSVRSPLSQELLQSMLEQSDQLSLPNSPDFWNMSLDSGRFQEVFEDFSLPEMCDSALTQMPRRRSPSLFFASSSLTNSDNSLPQDAVLLLNHYTTTVIKSLTPFRHTKTPWHILFLPHAKSCLAALMLGEHLDHASLTAFCGTLAMSAFSLGGLSRSAVWLKQGKRYEHQARNYARLMLRTAYDIPKVSKYKSILMALMTMVQLSLFSGNRHQTEQYLLEAEKFIRLRGLNRTKSRRVRLLHHCYAFERIFHETMFVTDSNDGHRHHVRNAIESSGMVVYGQDAPSFRIFPWTDLSQDMLRIKDQDDGENDLHIERPGLWAGTLYPEVYGVQEAWLFLLSQVIRLGNEKDTAEAGVYSGGLSLKDFTTRAKAIEKAIIGLQYRSDNTTDFGTFQGQLDQLSPKTCSTQCKLP